jgi:hypothetical protein
MMLSARLPYILSSTKLEANLYVFQIELAYLIVLSISFSVGHLHWLKMNLHAVTIVGFFCVL